MVFNYACDMWIAKCYRERFKVLPARKVNYLKYSAMGMSFSDQHGPGIMHTQDIINIAIQPGVLLGAFGLGAWANKNWAGSNIATVIGGLIGAGGGFFVQSQLVPNTLLYQPF